MQKTVLKHLIMKNKKSHILIAISLIASFTNLKAQTNMEKLWFTYKNCSSLEIKRYKSISDHQVTQSVKIGDLKFIQRLMNYIEEIPSNGDKMKSFLFITTSFAYEL